MTDTAPIDPPAPGPTRPLLGATWGGVRAGLRWGHSFALPLAIPAVVWGMAESLFASGASYGYSESLTTLYAVGLYARS